MQPIQMSSKRRSLQRTALWMTTALGSCWGCATRIEPVTRAPDATNVEPPRSPTTATPFTRSPQVPTAPVPLSGTCHGMDEGLVAVANTIAREVENTGAMLSAEELTFELRKAGLPYVWPTVFTATGGTHDSNVLRDQLLQWLGGLEFQGAQRCGIAIKRSHNGARDVLVALVVDALADALAVPRRVQSNTAVTFAFDLRAPATEVSLLTLGPVGLPREVVADFDPGAGRVRSTLSFATPGRWLVQLLATLESGPRPVAEVELWVDVPIAASFESVEVPGETASATGDAPDNTAVDRPVDTAGNAANNTAGGANELRLTAMLNAARQSEGLKSLVLDPRLSELALAHTRRMEAQQLTTHDAGDGDPEHRLMNYRLPGGVTKGPIGENVARASSLRGAHRALWQSPAHRRTLLYKDFTHVGVGIVTRLGGEVWATELFVGPGNSTDPASE